MISTASAGTAERITARICFNLLRAGSGTWAKYSSTFLGALLLVPEPRLPRPRTRWPLAAPRAPLPADFAPSGLAFFMRAMLQALLLQMSTFGPWRSLHFANYAPRVAHSTAPYPERRPL